MEGLIKPWAVFAALALYGCASTSSGTEGGSSGTSAPAVMNTAAAEAPVSEASTSEASVGMSGSSDLPSFYSGEQAARGEGLFRETCLACHESSEFQGSTFERQWRGETVRDLFATIAYSMPDDNPGGLPTQTYVDIIAYILDLNGYPAGTVELTADRDAMRALTLWPQEQARR